ncbi:response regulator [Pseudomonas viridiflava]|uniref:phosphorylase family protein n=1 Tax=Pseudomonas viridiflava TaxID=33069 RepID=UPI000F040793|nr:response regulator [Pseudomonas viridiflava]
MIKILIVDDEYKKVLMIKTEVSGLDVDVDIEHATTVTAARRLLQKQKYDVLVIDLNLPDAAGAIPSDGGGLKFYDLLILDVASSIPADIIFLTGHENLASSLQQEITGRGVSLCQFVPEQDQWKLFVKGRVTLAAARSKRISNLNADVDVAIITALGPPEFDAVLKLPYNWAARRIPGDPTGYHFGTMKRQGKDFNVVAASARRKGMPSSAALAMKMVESFRPKYIVMLGICAGVKARTNLGDVIFANPSWDCGSGKLSEDHDGSIVFQAAPFQNQANPHISSLAMELAGRNTTISAISSGWSGDSPQGRLAVRVGPMASGAAVLATSSALAPIAAQNRELLAVEMEAYAVMAAADFCKSPAPIALAIKSVCDFADAEKGDNWQEYAAYTSASFFHQLFTDPDFPS